MSAAARTTYRTVRRDWHDVYVCTFFFIPLSKAINVNRIRAKCTNILSARKRLFYVHKIFSSPTCIWLNYPSNIFGHAHLPEILNLRRSLIKLRGPLKYSPKLGSPCRIYHTTPYIPPKFTRHDSIDFWVETAALTCKQTHIYTYTNRWYYFENAKLKMALKWMSL